MLFTLTKYQWHVALDLFNLGSVTKMSSTELHVHSLTIFCTKFICISYCCQTELNELCGNFAHLTGAIQFKLAHTLLDIRTSQTFKCTLYIDYRFANAYK